MDFALARWPLCVTQNRCRYHGTWASIHSTPPKQPCSHNNPSLCLSLSCSPSFPFCPVSHTTFHFSFFCHRFFLNFAFSSLASPSLFSFTWPQPFLGCAPSSLPPLPGPTPPEGRESNRLPYRVSSPGCQSASIRLAVPPTACSPLVHNHPPSLYLYAVFLSSLFPFPFLRSFACLTSQTFSSIYTTHLLIACYALHHKRRLDATTYFLLVNTLLAHISALSAVKCKTHQFETLKPLRVAIAAVALVVSAQKATTLRLALNPP